MASVYDQHHRIMRAIALRMLGDPDAADDLVHDVFTRLPRAITTFRGDSSLRTFLVGMVVNCSKRHVRTAVRQRAALERMAHQPHAKGLDPEESVRRTELAALLNAALETLSSAQRAAFILREVQEYSASEAAAILEVPEATVRTRVFYAKRRLRELLEWAATDHSARSSETSCEYAA